LKIYWEPKHTRRGVFNDGDRLGGIGGDRPDLEPSLDLSSGGQGFIWRKGIWPFFWLNDDLTCPQKNVLVFILCIRIFNTACQSPKTQLAAIR
jgi:hypothetical protein